MRIKNSTDSKEPNNEESARKRPNTTTRINRDATQMQQNYLILKILKLTDMPFLKNILLKH